MTLGQNIITIRKKLKISQNDLGKTIGTSGDIIGRYERDEVKPSIEVAIKISEALKVSLDYLVGKTSLELDNDTLKRIEQIADLPNNEKDQIYLVIDALLRDFKTKQAYAK
ncbi:HTH-type transcriptional regulator ImmR [Flavobacterium columnare]|uniref:HTH-type transcriptional regulator ImmR n=1 Tax=Flavobacterium columnare TaxID=996 RepID=A0A2N9P7B8_9FLAO|nr:helix-turn-helix transcriptional regulator [Flavobacterium columnare]SPE76253.1 HTH-type transcriptional regulator ImmR [Flavobacterium columnare]